jgi:hypothetical protein
MAKKRKDVIVNVFWSERVVTEKTHLSCVTVEIDSDEYKRLIGLENDFDPSRDMEILNECNVETLYEDFVTVVPNSIKIKHVEEDCVHG